MGCQHLSCQANHTASHHTRLHTAHSLHTVPHTATPPHFRHTCSSHLAASARDMTQPLASCVHCILVPSSRTVACCAPSLRLMPTNAACRRSPKRLHATTAPTRSRAGYSFTSRAHRTVRRIQHWFLPNSPSSAITIASAYRISLTYGRQHFSCDSVALPITISRIRRQYNLQSSLSPLDG